MPFTENVSARGVANNGSTSNLSVLFGGGVVAAAGQLIVVGALVADTIANVTKPAGYTDIITPLQISGGACMFGMAKFAAGGETGLSFSHSGGANTMAEAIFLYDGALSPLTIDKAAGNPTDFAQHVSWPTGTTAATTQADDLALGFCVLNGAATVPLVSGGTLIANVNSNELLVASQPLTTTGAQSMTFSWTGSNFVVAAIAVLKAAAVLAEQASMM